MKKERILALADLIERQPHTTLEENHGFYMGNWTHNCGTPSCIAGWAAYASVDGILENMPGYGGYHEVGMDFLGICRKQADALFEPDLLSEEEKEEEVDPTEIWGFITPAQAAATLRRLAETGNVKWDV